MGWFACTFTHGPLILDVSGRNVLSSKWRREILVAAVSSLASFVTQDDNWYDGYLRRNPSFHGSCQLDFLW